MSHGHNFSILHWHFLKGFPYWASSVTTVTVFPSPDTHLDPGTPLRRHTSDSVTYTVTLKYTRSAENFDFDS